MEKKDEVLSGKAVNRELLELEYTRLKKNYNTFKNSKELIVQVFLDTIQFIKEYVRDSNMKINLNLDDYDPNDFFEKISYTQGTTEEMENKMEDSEQKHNFNSALLKEVIPLQVLMHKISSGSIKKEDLNFKELPS